MFSWKKQKQKKKQKKKQQKNMSYDLFPVSKSKFSVRQKDFNFIYLIVRQTHTYIGLCVQIYTQCYL